MFNASTHQIVARQLWKAWNLSPTDPVATENDARRATSILPLVAKRQKMLHDTWLSHVGHQRPGMTAGQPLAEAEKQAAAIRVEIRKTLSQQ